MEIDVVQALFLGLVQGFTEFFPVSSSGHLVMFHDILGTGSSVLFDTVLHVGTLVAVFAVFFRELLGLLKPPFNRLLILAGASVPAALTGFFLGGRIESFFDDVRFLPLFFTITAALLLAAEIVTKRRKTPTRPVGPKIAAVMGIAQGVALFPGLSRSGATISAGVTAGAERGGAARFSFFMSIPVIAGAALYSALKGGDGGAEAGFTAMAAGFVAAAVSGFFALKLMLRVIKKSNYKWFSLYLVLLSAALFVKYFIA